MRYRILDTIELILGATILFVIPIATLGLCYAGGTAIAKLLYFLVKGWM